MKVIAGILLSIIMQSTHVCAQFEGKFTENIITSIGVNQFQRGNFFMEWGKIREAEGLVSYSDHKLAVGYNPWENYMTYEFKNYCNFSIWSLGGSMGFYDDLAKPGYSFAFKPQIGINLLIMSFYYGYNFRTNPSPTFNNHNLCLSFVLFLKGKKGETYWSWQFVKKIINEPW